MSEKHRTARLSGLLYLIVVITGMFSLAYIPQQLFSGGDADTILANIRGNESLFRMGLASSAVCYIAFTFLAFALYQLLKTVNEAIAKTMVVLAVISVPMSFVNLQHKYAILDLLNSSPSADMAAQVTQHLSQYNDGILVTTVFWGLWLLPFGYLVYRSGFLPRLLGILLMLGCFAYLVNFFGNTLSGRYASTALPGYLRMLPAAGEIGSCLWLLLAGARNWRTMTHNS